MGRHSAPDDEPDVATPAPAVTAPPRPGRHARLDEVDEAAAKPAPKPRPPAAEPSSPNGAAAPDATSVAPEPAPQAERTPPVAPSAPPPVARGNHATAADLALLRARPDVRNRCIAAVVVPFVIYSVVLVLLGAVHVYLIWVWIPLVTAGVTAGSFLDAAHRHSGGG